MGRPKKEPSLDSIIDKSVRDALVSGYEKDADKLKAISLGIDWAKVKHKIDDDRQSGTGLFDPEEETND